MTEPTEEGASALGGRAGAMPLDAVGFSHTRSLYPELHTDLQQSRHRASAWTDQMFT